MSTATTSSKEALGRRSTWAAMTARNASLARLDVDSASSTSSHRADGPALEATIDAILSPDRLAALQAVDVPSIPYNTYSLFSYLFSVRGRNLGMLIAPLLSLLMWGLGWQLLFIYIDGETAGEVRESLASMDSLITPLLVPLSFLLTFRLGRAAVRYWDARRAAGKMVEICRSNMAMVSVWVLGPTRMKRRRNRKQPNPRDATENHSNEEGAGSKSEVDVKHVQQSKSNNDHATEDTNDDREEALELLCEYARWLSTLPIAVKHFLRPTTRKGWDPFVRYKKRRFEIGSLLSDEDACRVIMEYDDADSKPTYDPDSGVRARDPPLVVLNRLHELAYEATHFDYGSSCQSPTPQERASFYQQITDQINVLFGAYGAMERIKLTPLPFAYAIHLRTFLLLYLFLWNMSSVAELGWVALPFLFLLNWSLLGIEAAAVECERPFDYRANHLTLGLSCVVISRNIGQALKELAR